MQESTDANSEDCFSKIKNIVNTYYILNIF